MRRGYSNQPNSSNAVVKWPDGSSANIGNIIKQNNREFIRDLNSGVMRGFIAGMIIAKQDPRSFADRKDPNQMRWQVRFTIRDAPSDYINVCCWGGDTFINDISRLYKIGDVVQIENGLVQMKQHSEAEEKYNPSTPSQFNITLNEAHALIQHYNGNEMEELSSMSFLPAKDSSDYFTLGDVIANGQNLNGNHINIVAAIRDAGEPKQIVTKTGKEITRRELKIFDESCASFPLVMWDNELSEMANTWSPQEVVLFLADVKVHFDNYKKCMVATCDGKTIITVNPDIPEAHHIYNYAQSVDMTDMDFANGEQDTSAYIENIEDVFTIEELEDKINDENGQSLFYGILNACITQFDIDSSDAKCSIVSSKCCSCKRTLRNDKCSNVNCPLLNQFQESTGNSTAMEELDLKLELSDSTGGLGNFRLHGNPAETFIGYNANDFLALPSSKRTDLKWKFLFDRFKIIFKCSTGKADNHKYLDVLQASAYEPITRIGAI